MAWGVYARISANRDDERHGVRNQETDCRRLVTSRGETVGPVYVDNDVSATSGRRRPEYQRMLSDARAGVITGIVGWHVDRLTRRPVELEELIDLHDRHGVRLATVHGDIDLGTPSGRLMARQLASFASYEVEHKSTRQRRRADQMAAEGVAHGGARPFGYEPRRTAVRPAEAERVRWMAGQFIAGVSIHRITVEMQAWGPTPRDGKWTSTTVKRILRSAGNAGLREHRGVVVGPGQWEPIVDEETWRRCCAMLSSPARLKFAADTRVRINLLAGGMVVCGRCDARMGGRNSNSGKRGYVCQSKSPYFGCGSTRIAAEPFEDWIGAQACARVADPRNRAAITARMAEREQDQGGILDELAADEELLRQLGEDFAERRIPRESFVAATGTVQRRVDAANQRLAAATLPAAVPSLDATRLAAWWDTALLEQRRALVKTMLAEPIKVGPATRMGVTRMDVDRVSVTWA
jgi:DNA invertase Pin-like site-specific DNA recombinase